MKKCTGAPGRAGSRSGVLSESHGSQKVSVQEDSIYVTSLCKKSPSSALSLQKFDPSQLLQTLLNHEELKLGKRIFSTCVSLPTKDALNVRACVCDQSSTDFPTCFWARCHILGGKCTFFNGHTAARSDNDVLSFCTRLFFAKVPTYIREKCIEITHKRRSFNPWNSGTHMASGYECSNENISRQVIPIDQAFLPVKNQLRATRA